MRSDTHSPLLNSLAWSFDEIEASDKARAIALAKAGPADALIKSLKIALEATLGQEDGVHFGCEHLDGDWNRARAVVQFPVGTKLFDWFFNARTGYRAHFRAHHKCGLRFNNQIVEANSGKNDRGSDQTRSLTPLNLPLLRTE